MGTIVVTENATLDGVIEQVGDWFAPAAGDANDADIVATLREPMQPQKERAKDTALVQR